MTPDQATVQALRVVDQIGASDPRAISANERYALVGQIMLAQAIGRIATVIEDMATEAKKEQAKSGRG